MCVQALTINREAGQHLFPLGLRQERGILWEADEAPERVNAQKHRENTLEDKDPAPSDEAELQYVMISTCYLLLCTKRPKRGLTRQHRPFSRCHK